MERLDFASVMAVLRRNIPDEDFGNQTDFLYSLFIDVNLNPYFAVEFDQGQVLPLDQGIGKVKSQYYQLLQGKGKPTEAGS